MMDWHGKVEQLKEEHDEITGQRDRAMSLVAEQAEDIIGLKTKNNALFARVLELEAQRDALLAACIAALALLTGTGQDGTLGHHSDNPVPAKLRAAIALAATEGEENAV